MSTFDTLKSEIEQADLKKRLLNCDISLVRRAIAAPKRSTEMFALLLSPAADSLLEEMAQAANRITLERFGKTMQLYAPLYLSNRCVGRCPYCGFSRQHRITRRALSVDEVSKEATLLREAGMRSILLVAGDDPNHVDLDFLIEAIQRVHQIVPSVSVEVAPLDEAGYRALAAAGADGVTLYQETYNRNVYEHLHAGSPKEGFDTRLEALSNAGRADFCKLTVGALWGLAPWRQEALMLGLHARTLETNYWRSHISVGLPRLRQVPDSFSIPYPLKDRAFVHVITALRLFLNDAGLVLSTRESPTLRRNLTRLGITQMSAGSSTRPGGYTDQSEAGEQFQVADHRSPKEVASELLATGYEPVWKNWDRVFTGGS